MKKLAIFLVTVLFLNSCSDNKTETIQVGENTFVHGKKVFRIIDNEITELGSLASDSITISTV